MVCMKHLIVGQQLLCYIDRVPQQRVVSLEEERAVQGCPSQTESNRAQAPGVVLPKLWVIDRRQSTSRRASNS